MHGRAHGLAWASQHCVKARFQKGKMVAHAKVEWICLQDCIEVIN